jgi:hypothetical protein
MRGARFDSPAPDPGVSRRGLILAGAVCVAVFCAFFAIGRLASPAGTSREATLPSVASASISIAGASLRCHLI